VQTFSDFKREETEQPVPVRFEQQVRKYPHRRALKTARLELTYEALNRAANRVARAVLARSGTGDEPVCLLLGQGAPQIIAILSTLKAGKICVPADPHNEPGHLTQVLRDSGARVVVTDNAHALLAAALGHAPDLVINLDEVGGAWPAENLDLALPPDKPAAIVYVRSHEAGEVRFKGVVHSHRSLLHLALRQTNCHHISADDHLSLITSCDLPASMGDMLAALLNGAALLSYKLRDLGVRKMAPWLIEEKVTIFHSGPNVFRHFLHALGGAESFPDLRLVRLGGGPVYRHDVETFRTRFGPGCELAVLLETPEMGALSSQMVDRATSPASPRVPVGHAAEGIELLLLDDAGQPVGPNGIGEITVRSPYLPLGYWQDAGRSRAVFPPTPQANGARLYRTGEMGQLDQDGGLKHLGDRDDQIIIRDRRVDTAEIETALLALGTIRSVAVVSRNDRQGNPVLLAYVVPAVKPPPPARELRHALVERLPEELVPFEFAVVDALPYQPNGEVDRRALPAPEAVRPSLANAYVAPYLMLQNVLIELWERSLGVRPIGIQDNFFDLGGDSVRAAEMLLEAEDILGQVISSDLLLAGATVEQLTAALLGQTGTKVRPSIVEVQRGTGERRWFFMHGDFIGGGFYCVNLARRLGKDQPFYALQPHGVTGPFSAQTVEDMAADHLEALVAFQPHGPYMLGGHCNGSLVAYEVARRLCERGEQVDVLALVCPSFLARPRPSRVGAGNVPRAVVDLSHLASTERLQALRKIYEAACTSYFPQPYPGKVSVIYAMGEFAADHTQFDWRTVAREVEVHLVPGGHLTILTRYLPDLAEMLRSCAERAGSSKSAPAQPSASRA
jgi:acyl-coenzyme A synthetase/AMP-(fatty) acid ligase/thioesterase domain-containing protein